MVVYAFLDVDRPWIAWLVYRGEMVSRAATRTPTLSVWHATYLLGSQRDAAISGRYARELEIDAARNKEYPKTVSRLSGFYAFEDPDAARRAAERWGIPGFQDEHLVEIALDENVLVSRYDAEWISRYLSSRDSSWIPKYLSGQSTERPIWELLVEGRGFVLGTRVRQLAYDTVKKTWPTSLGLLELSRVAVELRSDLGLIVPILTVENSQADLKLYLNFQDAENPEFLQRLRDFAGPRNLADLNATSELVLPDLGEFSMRFPLAVGASPETTP